MGELSKKIGEQGEKTVRQFFESIGWNPLTAGTDIQCLQPSKHKRKEATSNRETHGIDLAFTYVCPIVPSYRRNILISIKNSNDDETRTLRAQIKGDLTDLSTALACFKRSQMKADFVGGGGGATCDEDIGLLLKINKDPDGEKSFLGDLGTREQVEVEGSDAVCFVENARFDFVEHCMRHLTKDLSEWNYAFLHAKNSLTPSALSRKTNSSLLPVQSLVGGPLIVRLEEKNRAENHQSSLMIFSQENFSASAFKRLAHIGLDVSMSWVNVDIVFPDYQEIRDHRAVEQLKTGLADKDFAKRIRCKTAELRSRLA